MARHRINHVTYGRLIKQLETVVAASRKRFQILETKAAIFDADIKRKNEATTQLIEYALVDAFDIDFQVIWHAEFTEQFVERDTTHGDLFGAAGMALCPPKVEAAPVIVVEIDVELRLAGLVPDRRIEDFYATIADRRAKPFPRLFAKRRIGIERDDTKSTA